MISLPTTYHDLKKWAIAHFRVKAGYILPKMPLEFDDLPSFYVFHNQYMIVSQNHSHSRHIAKYAQLWLKCNEPMCYRCADGLELLLQPNREFVQIRIQAHYSGKICSFCGMVCDDDEFPF